MTISPPERDVDGVRERPARLDVSIAEHDARLVRRVNPMQGGDCIGRSGWRSRAADWAFSDGGGEPHSCELEPAQACATSDPSPATDRVGQHGEDARVGWSAELSPWCVTVTGCRGRGAKGDIVAASCLHDPPDRVHNDLWLVDRYHVTGLSSDHQTSSF
jgi:hypothetical protein